MNQPVLTEQHIRALLRIKTETKNLDYKKDINWRTATTDQKLGIVKHILAMSNTRDGGRIILGVKDKTFKLVGLKKKSYDSFDQTEVNDYLQKYTEPKFTCQVSKHVIDDKYVVAIDVPEFTDVPIICKVSANSSDGKRQILRSGQIYIRTEKATSEAISSAQEMREFLGQALVKKGDELLQNIERLIKGRPAKTTDESKERYDSEIAEANEFFDQEIGKELSKYGYWELFTYPVQYKEKRFPELPQLRGLIEKSRVRLRGWSFPHLDEPNTKYFGKGRQSRVVWEHYQVEGYRIYQSGLLCFKRVFWEDIQEDMAQDRKKDISFINVIWCITEFFLFLKRFYRDLVVDGDLYVGLALHGCDERQLASYQSGVHLLRPYTSIESNIAMDGIFKDVELKAGFKEIAAKWSKHIFHVFNWEDVTDEVIDNWQTRLIERTF